MSTRQTVQSKTAELARALGEKLRTQGSAFLQRAWEWSLRHPEITKYLLVSGGFSILMWLNAWRLRWVRKNTILELNLAGKEIVDGKIDPFTAALNQDIVPLSVLLDSIVQAATDRRVVGIVAKLGDCKVTLTQWQEIRDALKTFRQTGKKAICFAENFSEFSGATRAYWMATAFDEIYMPSSGELHLIGLRLDMMFLKGTLEKLEVEPHAIRRSEYKTALEQFTETSLTEPARVNWSGVMESIYGQFIKDIAEFTGKSTEEVRQLIEKGPFTSQQAKELGLITDVSYSDEFYIKTVTAKFGARDIKSAHLLFFRNYYKNVGPRMRAGPNVIAIVHAKGQIMMGDGDAGHNTIIRALREAADDKKVKAIILRVDSPGGSALASDLIWHEIQRIKAEKGKKIVASMGSMAASGGYYISAAAERIVAQPLTITGSIGVFAGKFNLRGMFKKIGINYDHIQLSSNAELYSALEGYTPENRKRIEAFVDEIYIKFKSCVSSGRNMTMEQVEDVAKGRVWMGEKAKEVGLVDRIGGLEAAIDEVRSLLALPVGSKFRLRTFPREPSLIKALLGARNSLEEDKLSASVVLAGALGWMANIPGLSQVLFGLFKIARVVGTVSDVAKTPYAAAAWNVMQTSAAIAAEPAMALAEAPLLCDGHAEL